jgi:hypothetical protein
MILQIPHVELEILKAVINPREQISVSLSVVICDVAWCYKTAKCIPFQMIAAMTYQCDAVPRTPPQEHSLDP